MIPSFSYQRGKATRRVFLSRAAPVLPAAHEPGDLRRGVVAVRPGGHAALAGLGVRVARGEVVAAFVLRGADAAVRQLVGGAWNIVVFN